MGSSLSKANIAMKCTRSHDLEGISLVTAFASLLHHLYATKLVSEDYKLELLQLRIDFDKFVAHYDTGRDK